MKTVQRLGTIRLVLIDLALTFVTAGDHLDAMFGPDAPPVGWDERNEYTRQRLELYYLSNAGAALSDSQLAEALAGRWPEGVAEAGPKRYGKDAARWVKVRRCGRKMLCCAAAAACLACLVLLLTGCPAVCIVPSRVKIQLLAIFKAVCICYATTIFHRPFRLTSVKRCTR